MCHCHLSVGVSLQARPTPPLLLPPRPPQQPAPRRCAPRARLCMYASRVLPGLARVCCDGRGLPHPCGEHEVAITCSVWEICFAPVDPVCLSSSDAQAHSAINRWVELQHGQVRVEVCDEGLGLLSRVCSPHSHGSRAEASLQHCGHVAPWSVAVLRPVTHHRLPAQAVLPAQTVVSS